MERYSLEKAEKEASEIKDIAEGVRNSRTNWEKPSPPLLAQDYKEAEERIEVSRELRKFQLPEVFKIPTPSGSKEELYAVLYDGTALLAELKRQRALVGEDGQTSLVTSIKNTFGLLRPEDTSTGRSAEWKELLKSVNGDYLRVDDHTYAAVFSKDSEKLAKDIMEFFSDKIIRLGSKNDDFENNRENITTDLKSHVLENLSKVQGVSVIDSSVQGFSEKSIDANFSIYPGLEHGIRFFITTDSEKVKEEFPYINIDEMPYVKNLQLWGGTRTQGYMSADCDIATLLELSAFLKERGHSAVLKMMQNPAHYVDCSDKLHYSYVV